MDNRFIHKWVSIECFKHDGSFHRFWDRGFILENNDDYLVLATKKAKVIESTGRKWFTKEPAITVFSKHEWWNTICMIKEDGISYYCNIASPCIFEDNKVKYIDYDLDTKLLPNKEILLLDEKEYSHHKKKYGYSEELDMIIRYQTDKSIQSMHFQYFPYQDNVIRKYFETFLKLTQVSHD